MKPREVQAVVAGDGTASSRGVLLKRAPRPARTPGPTAGPAWGRSHRHGRASVLLPLTCRTNTRGCRSEDRTLGLRRCDVGVDLNRVTEFISELRCDGLHRF